MAKRSQLRKQNTYLSGKGQIRKLDEEQLRLSMSSKCKNKDQGKLVQKFVTEKVILGLTM